MHRFPEKLVSYLLRRLQNDFNACTWWKKFRARATVLELMHGLVIMKNRTLEIIMGKALTDGWSKIRLTNESLFQKEAGILGIMSTLPARPGPNTVFEAQITCYVGRLGRCPFPGLSIIWSVESTWTSSAFEHVDGTHTWMLEPSPLLYIYPISPCSGIP